jgi:hypothetical protein
MRSVGSTLDLVSAASRLISTLTGDECPISLSFRPDAILHKLWGSQSWLRPAFSRLLRGTKLVHCPKEPPERRLRARLPAPQFTWTATDEKSGVIGQEYLRHNDGPGCVYARNGEAG